jgi:hypothetical protein
MSAVKAASWYPVSTGHQEVGNQVSERFPRTVVPLQL